MRFQTPLQPARLIRRYKRFLADITLEDGREVTAHVANPGAMLGLAAPGTRIWVAPNADPRRKLRWSWQVADLPGARVLVDTGLPNRIVAEALRKGPETLGLPAGYTDIRPEQRYAEKSRVDFLLRGGTLPDLYLEVKSVTLSRARGLAEFPDCVTARGARHLADLAGMVQAGARAMTLYLASRDDAREVALAADLDPAYAEAHARAAAAGVESRAAGLTIDRETVGLAGLLPTRMS